MKKIFSIIYSILIFLSCDAQNKKHKIDSNYKDPIITQNNKTMNTAVFGAGCFWCVEAVFQRLKGVDTVVSGYMGGKISNPTYKEVSSGLTGHAEVIKITYDSSVISYEQLVEVFFYTHDPTTLNKQGADEGTQYRSVIFYNNDTEKNIAQNFKDKFTKENTFGRPVVTEISPVVAFYGAEDYHQNFYNLNDSHPYCRVVINPKVEKFSVKFKHLLK